MIRAGFEIVTRSDDNSESTVMGESRSRARFRFDIHSPSSIVDVGRVTPRHEKEEQTDEVVQLADGGSNARGML